jgi:hypothetical protein
MRGADEFRAALEAGDVKEVRRISALAEPHLPQLSHAEAERVMHDARTRSRSIAFRKRAWSHRWLTERGLPSGLPDRLRPKAEQVCPRTVQAVGIACKADSPLLAPIVPLIRDAMQGAVLEAEADGRLGDSAHVRARMREARERTTRELLGRIGANA